MSAAAEGVSIAAARAPARQLVAWSLALALYAGFAAWLAAHPAAIASDDALNFAHGLVHFSVLDFAPQFPGYPGFVLMGRGMRLVFPAPVEALFALTVCVALALPPAAAWLAWRARASAEAALCAFLVVLTQPLLPALALDMLSDGAGLLFLLVFLALSADGAAARTNGARAGAWRTFAPAGLALAWAACCRPSYAALYAGAALGVVLLRPRAALPILAAALAVGAPTLLALYAWEGPLYWGEGLRFVSGHAELWGNTLFSERPRPVGWIASIAGVPWSAPSVALALAGAGAAGARWREAAPVLAAVLGAFCADLVWVGLFQNPEHLRHLAPLAALGGLALILTPRAAAARRLLTIAILAAHAAVLAATLDLDPRAPPPLQRAIARLAAAPPGSAVEASAGVATLRADLPRLRVYDAFYPADSAFGLRTARGDAFRLTPAPLPAARPIAVFPSRAPGERSLYLYRVKTAPTAPGA